MTAARGTGHPRFPLTPQTELPTGHSRPLFSFALSSGSPTFDPTGGCRGCGGGAGLEGGAEAPWVSQTFAQSVCHPHPRVPSPAGRLRKPLASPSRPAKVRAPGWLGPDQPGPRPGRSVFLGSRLLSRVHPQSRREQNVVEVRILGGGEGNRLVVLTLTGQRPAAGSSRGCQECNRPTPFPRYAVSLP